MREEWRDFVGGKWETEVDVRDFPARPYSNEDALPLRSRRNGH